jgi:hypothetical protein
MFLKSSKPLSGGIAALIFAAMGHVSFPDYVLLVK